MITKLSSNQPHVLWQSVSEEDCAVPESALAISVDASGIISIQQEADSIILNKASIPELCKLLKKLAE